MIFKTALTWTLIGMYIEEVLVTVLRYASPKGFSVFVVFIFSIYTISKQTFW